MLEEQINLFFLNPHVTPGSTGNFSVLYLLRRDALTCFGINPNDGQQISFKALFPAAMVTVTGIDLLGKLFAGDDSGRTVGIRFKSFLKKYFDSVRSEDDAEIIYQFRNSLLHSFGLFSDSFRFSATHTDSPLITRGEGNNIGIGYFTLHKELERAIVKYEADLRTREDLQSKFQNMISKYGFLKIV